MKIVTPIMLFVLYTAAAGCEAARDLLDPERIEARLRNDPSRPGKVGAVVGFAIHSRAASVAADASRALNHSCAIKVEPGQRYVMDLELLRERDDERVSSWTEQRSFSVDPAGDLAVDSSASYVTAIDQAGSVDNAWRIVADDAFLGTPARDGMLWYRRDAGDAERARVWSAGTGSLQALLDLAPTWRGANGTWTADPGGTLLRCGSADEGRGWVDRFVARATLRSASLEATPKARHFRGSWRLDDGSTLTAKLTDRIEPYAEDIVAPPVHNVVDVLRDQSLGDAVKRLHELAEEGILEVALQPTAAPSSTDEP